MAKIPKEWLLPESIVFTKQRNIMPIFRSCGLLTERELEITDVEDCVILLDRLHSQEWSALEVTVAFCKRSAIAQQLINPLMDIDYEGAMSRAKELDQHLSTHGKPIGPLHGLPISLKVSGLPVWSCLRLDDTEDWCRILQMSRACTSVWEWWPLQT